MATEDRYDLYQIADELRGIAALGLRFATNEYDVERYRRVHVASARLLAALAGGAPQGILPAPERDLMHISPAAGAEAVVLHDGALLLIQRRDTGLWALPGGLVEVGETLAEAAERELWEEAGLRGRAVELLGVFDSRLWQTPIAIQLYHVVFRVEVEAPEPVPGPEALAAAFFAQDELPPLTPGHAGRVPLLLDDNRSPLRGERPRPFFDAAPPASD